MATHPTGKGMFVRNWGAVGTPAQGVARAQSAGLSWVSPLYGWWGVGKKAPRNTSTAQKYGDAFRAAGIEVWPWIYPVPGRESEVAAAIQRAVAYGDDGVILDPEAEYRKKPSAAKTLVSVARKAAHGLPIGMSSYGYTKYHPTFPYKVFSALDFGVPQVYDLKDKQSTSYQQKGVQSWRNAGFDIVIPALTTASASAAEVLAEYSQAPVVDGGVVWWDWQTTQQSEWQAIGSIKLDRTQTGVAITLLTVAAIGGLIWYMRRKG